MIEDLSSSKESELLIFKGKVNEVVNEIKCNRNYTAAGVLILKHNLSFVDLIKSTVKLNIEDLAFLADNVISQK
ncbi:MAG: hypothetical protein WC141_03630 [Arcobacteraceae bacterium]